jgi:hypothetical protein
VLSPPTAQPPLPQAAAQPAPTRAPPPAAAAAAALTDFDPPKVCALTFFCCCGLGGTPSEPFTHHSHQPPPAPAAAVDYNAPAVRQRTTLLLDKYWNGSLSEAEAVAMIKEGVDPKAVDKVNTSPH